MCFCGGKDKNVIIHNNNYKLCTRCGLLQKTVFLTPDSEKERYDKHICDDKYLGYMETIFNKLKNHLKKGISLDYGCGQVHALSDILNKNGYLCDYYDLYYYPELKNKTYDNIILIEVFEHLKEPYEEINKLKSLLKKDGKIIIMTKVYDNVDLNNWWYLRDKTHYSFIKKDTLTKWNLDFNLEVDGDIFILLSI